MAEENLPRPSTSDQEYLAAILRELREIKTLLGGAKEPEGKKKQSLLKKLKPKRK